jgi:hypothetical protein
MGQIRMNKLFAIAAFASLEHTPAQGWTPTHAGWLIGDQSQSARQPANDHLLSVTFPEPVAINQVSAVVELDQATVFIDPVGSQE